MNLLHMILIIMMKTEKHSNDAKHFILRTQTKQTIQKINQFNYSTGGVHQFPYWTTKYICSH